MPVQEEEDRHGFLHKFLDIDGKRFPNLFSEQVIRDIPKLQVNDSDVLICGYLRSGTHWMFEMVSMLLRNQAETIPLWKVQQMLEYTSYEELHKAASPRVFNTHLLYEDLPRSFVDRGTKIVYVVRDPRDVAVSYFHLYKDLQYYNGTWGEYLELFRSDKVHWGSFYNHLNNWAPIINSKSNILVVYYEDTKKDPMKTAKRLSEFLRAGCKETLLKEIVEKCTFSQMAKDKREYSVVINDKNIMYRKGVVGDWKNWFTVAQSDAFDKLLEEKVGHNNLVQRYLPTQSVETERR